MIALTKKSGYALMAISHLAKVPPGQLASARSIARRFDLPLPQFMNVLKELAAAGYVESVRGARGGYRMARDPREITLADLVISLEGPIRLAECVTGQVSGDKDGLCRLLDRCPIADPVHRVQRRLHDFFKTITLTEIIEPAALPAVG